MENEQPKTITVIGGSVLDVLSSPVPEIIAGPDTVQLDSVKLYPGGNALNESTVLALQGIRPELVSLVGNDLAGSILKSHMEKHGIRLHVADPSIATPVNLVLIEASGQRRFASARDTGLRLLEKKHIPPVVTDAVCLADCFASRKLGLEDVTALFVNWKKEGKTTAMDVVRPKNGETSNQMEALLSSLDFLFMNLQEGKALTGKDTPASILSELARCGANTVLLKLGEEGAAVLHDGAVSFYPAVPVDRCVDTTGCGDSFAGAFLAAWCHGQPFSACVQAALEAGALCCTAIGATAALEWSIMGKNGRCKNGKDL